MKRRVKQRMDAGGLARELVSPPTLCRDALAEQWREFYGTEPPARIGGGFLISAVAYRLQEQALGGLKPATRRYLEKVAADVARKKIAGGNSEGDSKAPRITAPAATIKPGTRLLREWHGVTYEVLVLENGVQCNGVQYRSLSEVARTITGTKWSGPVFFGLKKKRAA